jgi:hypothetical protein
MQKHTSVSFLIGARCYTVGINSVVADNIFFLSNDVNDEMLMLTCGSLPAFLKSKPNPPILQTPMSMFDLDYLVRNLRLEYEWLQFVSLTNEVLDVKTVSWSAYNSSKGREPHVNISISSLTSLLRKKMLSATTL